MCRGGTVATGRKPEAGFSLVEMMIALVSMSLLTVGVYTTMIRRQQVIAPSVTTTEFVMKARQALQQMKEKVEAVGFNPTLTPPSYINDGIDIDKYWHHRFGFGLLDYFGLILYSDRVDANGVEGHPDGLINNPWIPDLQLSGLHANIIYETLNGSPTISMDTREGTIYLCTGIYENASTLTLVTYQNDTPPSGGGSTSASRRILLDNLVGCFFLPIARPGKEVPTPGHASSEATECDLAGVIVTLIVRSEKPVPGYVFTPGDLDPKLAVEEGTPQEDWPVSPIVLGRIQRSGGDYRVSLVQETMLLKSACVPGTYYYP